jgi:hypothetical protein
MDSALFSDAVPVTKTLRSYARTVLVPPGEHIVCLKCGRPKSEKSSAWIDVGFDVRNFKLRDLGRREAEGDPCAQHTAAP